MIRASYELCGQHAGTLDYLVKNGKIPKVKLEIGKETHAFDCLWTATAWLKQKGLSTEGNHKWIYE